MLNMVSYLTLWVPGVLWVNRDDAQCILLFLVAIPRRVTVVSFSVVNLKSNGTLMKDNCL